MVEATFPDGTLLATVLQCVEDLAEDVYLEFSKTGLQFVATDEDCNVNAFFKLRAEYFSPGYKCDQDAVIAMKVSILYHYLKFATKDGGLVLAFNNEDNKLQLKFRSCLEASTNVLLSALALKDKRRNIRETISRYICSVEMPSNYFVSTIRYLSKTRESITFKGTESPSALVLTSDEDSNERVTLIKPQNDRIVVNISESFKYSYSTRFLKNFIKSAKLSEKVAIKVPRFKNDESFHVIVLEYKLQNSLKISCGYLRFYLRNRLKDSKEILT